MIYFLYSTTTKPLKMTPIITLMIYNSFVF
jgi:hypothetical protein